MSGPRPPDNQPLKYAGYALLAVAALAAVLGLVSLAGGGDDAAPAAPPGAGQAAPPPPVPPPPTGPPAVPPSVPGAPPPAGARPSAPAPELPGAGLPADDGTRAGGSGSGGGKMGGSVDRAPVRVYNNSLIRGLADQAAEDMRDSGWQVTEVGNYPSGIVPTSTVYYRPGTGEQAAARSLADDFGLRSLPRFAGLSGASPGLIVILTRDYQRR